LANKFADAIEAIAQILVWNIHETPKHHKTDYRMAATHRQACCQALFGVDVTCQFGKRLAFFESRSISILVSEQWQLHQ
jgi:hypothetical protein